VTGYFAALAQRAGIPLGRGSGPRTDVSMDEAVGTGPVEENVEVVARPQVVERAPQHVPESEPAGGNSVEIPDSSMPATEMHESGAPAGPSDGAAREAREVREIVVARHAEATAEKPRDARRESAVPAWPVSDSPRDTTFPAASITEVREQLDPAAGPTVPADRSAELERGGFDRSRVWVETFHTVREWVAELPEEPEAELEQVREFSAAHGADIELLAEPHVPREPIVERFEEQAAPAEVRVSIGTISIVVEEPRSEPSVKPDSRRPAAPETPPPGDWTRLRRQYIR
jgi:hypothetical protein